MADSDFVTVGVDFPAWQVCVLPGDGAQGQFEEFPLSANRDGAVRKKDFGAAGKHAPILGEHTSAGGEFCFQGHWKEKTGCQLGGYSPSFHAFAGPVMDGSGDGLVEDAGEDAAVHSPGVALVAGLGRKPGKDFGGSIRGDGFVESHSHAGNIVDAADKAVGATRLFLHQTQLEG